MTFEIDVRCDIVVDKATVALLQASATMTLRQQEVDAPATVALLVTDDAKLRELNKAYRDVDKPTDVLSFEDGEPPFPDAPVHLGDIAISLERAMAQAEQGGHALEAELQLLTVHGVLHLLGYDHGDSAEKAQMWQAQSAILAELNCEITTPG